MYTDLTMNTISSVLGMNIFARFEEGGFMGMTMIFICLILAVFFSIRAFSYLKKDIGKFNKFLKLTNQIALLALVISVANSLFGLISAFDALEATGGAEPAIIAGGVKITLLSPLFGFIVLILGRLSTFILTWLSEAE
ncbi:hypothetical protein ACFOSV_16925 [Algoriphagus namhaensis]|uniref:MotA/TolQ/ExbB proton channel family protein n=1 Tax=Algoriphagus namhaensis TaxID=915353 RepID=A0ABV8AV51_9BACT